MTNVAILPTKDQQLAAASAAWLDAKRDENVAKAHRVAAEQVICALVDRKTEGTVTTETSQYKIKTEHKLNRDVDATKLKGLESVIPVAILQRLIKFVPELSVRELRYLEENEPEYYKAFAVALTVKPAKTAVSVEIK